MRRWSSQPAVSSNRLIAQWQSTLWLGCVTRGAGEYRKNAGRPFACRTASSQSPQRSSRWAQRGGATESPELGEEASKRTEVDGSFAKASRGQGGLVAAPRRADRRPLGRSKGPEHSFLERETRRLHCSTWLNAGLPKSRASAGTLMSGLSRTLRPLAMNCVCSAALSCTSSIAITRRASFALSAAQSSPGAVIDALVQRDGRVLRLSDGYVRPGAAFRRSRASTRPTNSWRVCQPNLMSALWGVGRRTCRPALRNLYLLNLDLHGELEGHIRAARWGGCLMRPSLVRWFEPPDGQVGDFGWICGYSADAPFLDSAAEALSQASKARRAQEGRVVLGLILDPGCRQISLLDVPGVAHLPARSNRIRPFRLLHAKVALLSFRDADDAGKWTLRLVVSTGNWTVQTLESLDLAWGVEVKGAGIRLTTNDHRDAADVAAADHFIKWSLESFDDRLLRAVHRGAEGLTSVALQRLDERIAACGRVARGVTTRFVDNRKRSLLDEIPRRIDESCRRGTLLMGSGFYEADRRGELPNVPDRIVDVLQAKDLLTRGQPDVRLIVNVRACRAIAARSLQSRIEVGAFSLPWRPPRFSGHGVNVRCMQSFYCLSTREVKRTAVAARGCISVTPRKSDPRRIPRRNPAHRRAMPRWAWCLRSTISCGKPKRSRLSCLR